MCFLRKLKTWDIKRCYGILCCVANPENNLHIHNFRLKIVLLLSVMFCLFLFFLCVYYSYKRKHRMLLRFFNFYVQSLNNLCIFITIFCMFSASMSCQKMLVSGMSHLPCLLCHLKHSIWLPFCYSSVKLVPCSEKFQGHKAEFATQSSSLYAINLTG